MRKTFKKQLWIKVLAVVLALALNMGALDGVIRLAVQEWTLGGFEGFLRPAAAKKVDDTVYDTGPEKNEPGRDKNVLPETAGPKKPRNPAVLEAKSRNEVREKRTEYSKTFKISDSEYRTEVYQEPVHYRDENNGLADIDNTLVESPEKGYAFENRANSLKVRFSENSWVKSREKAGETVRETSGTASREMFWGKPGEQKLGEIQQKEHAIAWRLLGSKESPARAVQNTLIYRGITDHTDLRYIIDGKTLKEEIILNDPEAPSEFKFALDIRHLDYSMRDDGSIDFTDPGTGDVIWNMPTPYMYDARGERSQAVTAEISRKYGLFGETVLTVTADPEWLTAPDRAYPVVIDPTLQPGERFGRDTFISSKYPDTAYNDSEHLYVGDTAGFGDTMSFFYFRDIIREANATVTEATFSVYAAGGSPDSVDLYRVIPDVMWDYEVLTWNWWQTVSARGDTLGELVDSTAGPSSGWWNFDVLDLVQRWMEDPVKKNGGLALVPGSGSGYVKLISSNYGADDDPRSDTYNSKHPKLAYTYTLNPPQPSADFSLGIDRDTGEIRVYGSARDDARIYLSTGDGDNYTTSADSSGDWEIDGLTFEEGKYKTISMYYTYEIEWTDEEGETHTETITGDTTSQKFLVTRYSKGARMKRMAKFYYLDGTKDDLLKEINEIDSELDMVVGDYVLIPDPKREKPYIGGEIIINPDEEYRLREKIRPLYANGDIVGNSVDAATGNFFVIDTDLSFDALGLPVEFTRFFNAREPEIYRGPMGQNWYMGYDKMLVKYEDGSILATGGDGGGYFFRKSGSRYVSDDDVTEQLVKNGDGTYSVITKYDTVYHFNDDGMLDRVTDRNGNAVTMTYDGEGLLRQVTDAAGRTCTLYYDEMGRVIIIQDPEGRQVDYDYDNWGRLLQVIDPNGGAVKYEYGYVDEEGLAHDNYLVTKVTDPMGNVAVVNEYDSQGRVIRQTDAAGYTVSMDYDSGRTTYTDRNGNEFIYEFDSEYRVTSISGPDTADGTVYVNYAAPAEDSKFTDTQTGGTVSGITDMSINEGTVTGEPDPVVTSASATRILAEYHYDGRGNRDTVTDAMGNVTQYDYDTRNNLTSVINADGKENTYVYDNDNNVTDIIDAMDNKTLLEYDGNGNLLRVTDAEGKTTTYTYYGSGQVKSVSDPAGKTVSYTYDSDGNAATVKDGRGYITYYRYDGISRLEEVEDPKGNYTYYEYDDNGNLLEERTPIGTTINSYNYNNYLTGTRDPEGNVTTFEYESRGLMVRGKDPLGKYTWMGYDGNGSRLWTKDANNNRTDYRYDDLGRLREIIEPAGDITTYSYDPNGNRTAVIDAKGETTYYEYDILNRLEAVIDPLGRRAAYTYDDLGNTLTYTDFDGTVTEYRYDSQSRVREVIDQIGSTTKFTYDRSGNRETVTNTLNQTYAYRYDDNNNLEKVINPAGNITRFEYDETNNRTAMIDALGQRTTYEYDDMGRLVGVADPLNRDTEIELDKNGNRLAVTDGNNNTTKFGYDANGRLEQVIDAKNNTTRYKYDDVGNLVLFTDANHHTTEYRYNQKNLLTEVINPLGQKNSFDYDQNGNIISKTDPNGSNVEYEYDELNRLLGAYYPDGSYVEYGYNDQGKREWMEDMYGTTWYDYDQMGRLTAVTNQDDMTTEYGYNQLDQKTKVRYPDGKEVTYSYDNLNRLETVTDRLGKATTYKYDAVGRRTDTVLPNGVVTSYDYDRANQLTAIASRNPADKLLAKYEYTYNGAGNRDSFTQTVEDMVYTTDYEYDPLNQLIGVDNPNGGQVTYDYDPAGNRIKMTKTEGDCITTTKYEYNEANELLRYNMNEGPYTEFRYDNNGNRTTRIEPGDRVTTYTWDYENRLTEVNFHQDKWVGFEYDGDGNRITKLSAMTQPWHEEEIKQDNGKGNDPEFVPPGQQKVKKQRADLVYMLLKNDRGEGGKSKGNSGGNGGGSSGNNGGGNSGGSNGNGNDKDKPDNGKENGNEKDKVNNGKDSAKVKNKDLDIKDREAKKEKAKAKKGYRKKGKYENRGKHLGWYKNGKIPQGPEGEKVEITYYLNDVSDPLTQVLMTYGEDGNFNAAYTYGLERIEVEALDETRPESQDPLYYLYDGLGSVTFMVKPDGNKRDHYRYDEFGKPAPGNSKLSQDGVNVLHNTFGYTGEIWDQESELLYLRARYYEPETGRFLSRDTYEGNLQNPLSKNLFIYVQNNPINFSDPTGKYRLGWFTELGHKRAYFENESLNEKIEMVSLVPFVGDAVKIGYDVYRGDLPEAAKDVLTAAVTIGAGKLLVGVAKAGSAGISWLQEKALSEAPGIVFNGITYMIQPNLKSASRDKIIFGIYKYMFGHAHISKNGLWVDPDHNGWKYWKSRLKEIDRAYYYGDTGWVSIGEDDSHRTILMVYAYFDTIEAILNDTYEDIEIVAHSISTKFL
ncbi:DNRLRE domain-containing protein [Phosphitispora fastidiosa]|uniref:DNRLRE domain-containing protein n=1 Tax=Phosphitispora fastidiosa TaxID=2837202 RepID=UPI001E50C21F|nr:DNRLRE domain-containing protein [Phosphitispora fastidiosa]MBU7005610.1 RHS repeat-associated protein [Phosphitispora fastidiosa]